MRRRHDTLLFVDEVQTGMWRTGPFVRSAELGLKPDLLTLGKGTSDMMFPSALTLHGDRVEQRLNDRDCDLAQTLGARCRFDHGSRTILNVLRWGTGANLGETVARRGQLFAELLNADLAGCRNVREVRSYGLLVGIELRVPNRWLRRAFPQMVLLSLMQHRRFPVLAGFCQYEPHVLKLTPPLTVSENELRQMSAAIGDVLRRHSVITLWDGLRHATKEARVWPRGAVRGANRT
jgi:4-aminobutyrate aminotransferase-like enzyme